MFTLAEKQKLVASRNDWFHSIDFGDGLVSPGTCTPEYLQFLWKTYQMPDNLSGLRILDIGTYDGWFAFECERRGAGEVVAVDIHPEDLRCFKLARTILDSQVKYFPMSVYELREDLLGEPFDIVLFPGVYYHLRHLFVALDNLWRMTKGFMIIETHVIDDHFVLSDGVVCKLRDIDPRLVDTPIYRFYRLNELNPVDYSNWFGGNIAAVKDSLLSAGFAPELLGAWGSRAAFKAVKNHSLPREWEIGSYEGARFTYREDGTWSGGWHDPKDHRKRDA